MAVDIWAGTVVPAKVSEQSPERRQLLQFEQNADYPLEAAFVDFWNVYVAVFNSSEEHAWKREVAWRPQGDLPVHLVSIFH